jgi:hypothetical protein
MAHDRFVNKALSELQEANRSPIYGYQDLPVLTLEEATEKLISLVPGVVDYVSTAKKQCNRSSTLLTWDESAAIYIYSMRIPFFSRLNDTLRAENRDALKPWFAFLKLFINALEKLPSTKGTIWRGVAGDVSSIFTDGDVHIWWSVNSCSMDLKVVERYLDVTGTVFAIDTIYGKDISAFSTFPEEQEIVLMPGTHVSAKCLPLNFESRFFIIHLKEENEQRLVRRKVNQSL